MAKFDVTELRIGRVAPLGPSGVPSAIDKQRVDRPVLAGPLGLEGDEQGDRKHHGGPDKALHAYAVAHMPQWVADLPQRAERFVPGAFGENLVVAGVTEADICLGDRWRIGNALTEVSQARQPCWRLNLRFDQPDMARRVQESGRSGWYFRVIEPGNIAGGDHGLLIERPHPAWTLARVSHLLYHDRMNVPGMTELAALPCLTPSWRRLLDARLASGKVEGWERRIETPDR